MKKFLILTIAAWWGALLHGQDISTQITINAAPGQVWAVLTDFEKYPEWNPFIRSISGEVAVGNDINIVVQPATEDEMTFAPEVLVYAANKEFRWIGTFGTSWIFAGEHAFELVDNGDGTTTLIHSENFSGILSWFFDTGNTKAGFEAMNRQLKERVEAPSR
jgi:hypothetical protein